MPLCRLDDVDIHHTVHGADDAPTVVLAHGFCTSAAMWDRQLPALLPRYRVITYDARGHGLSTAPAGEESYRLGRMVADLHGLLGHLGVERAHIAGHSMGGGTAMAFGARHPELCIALLICNIDGGHQPADPVLDAQRDADRQRGREIVRERGLVHYARRILDNRLAPPFVLDDPIARRRFIERYSLQPDNGFFGAGTARPWAEPWLKQAAAGVALPIGILAGDQDVYYRGARALHDAQGGSFLATIEDAPHDSMNARPDAFNRALLDYLDSVQAGSPLDGERTY